jgi:hypothetical protein
MSATLNRTIDALIASLDENGRRHARASFMGLTAPVLMVCMVL